MSLRLTDSVKEIIERKSGVSAGVLELMPLNITSFIILNKKKVNAHINYNSTGITYTLVNRKLVSLYHQFNGLTERRPRGGPINIDEEQMESFLVKMSDSPKLRKKYSLDEDIGNEIEKLNKRLSGIVDMETHYPNGPVTQKMIDNNTGRIGCKIPFGKGYWEKRRQKILDKHMR